MIKDKQGNTRGVYSSLYEAGNDLTAAQERWVVSGRFDDCYITSMDGDLKEYPLSFDTGGYTGDWGSSGRLAMLHQKELILNKDDTANMLDAVQTIRDIAGLNDSISQTIANSIGQLMLKSITANSGNNINTTSNSNTSNIL